MSRSQVPQPWPYYHYHGSKNIICCTAQFPCHSTMYPPTSSLTEANHLDLLHIMSNFILSIEQNSGRRTWRTRSPTCALFIRNSASILEQFVKTELYFFLAGNLSSTHEAARQIKNYLLVKTCRLKPWFRFLQSY